MKRSGCIHCGTPLRRGSGPEGFCCAGCEQVHGLIQKDGLEAFYALQDQTGRPVESLAG
ncbi:MAG: heavy metal translocating P-type ATPase metal-binding domain-containing protein, partial [Coraliomargarita sp.]